MTGSGVAKKRYTNRALAGTKPAIPVCFIVGKAGKMTLLQVKSGANEDKHAF